MATQATSSIDIYSTEDLRKFCEAVRAEAASQADALSVLATSLHRSLKQSIPGSPMLMGMDASRAARMVTRHIVRMADAQVITAKAAQRTWLDYQQYVYNVVHAPRAQSFKV